MEVITDLGLVVWCFITLIFLCFPLYKRIPERALHGIVTFFAGLLVFCGFDAHGRREDPGRERA